MRNGDDRQWYIDAFFQDFRNKIKRCEKLFENIEYHIECGLLLCCHIDALASLKYGHVQGEGKEHFIQLLIDYSPYKAELEQFFREDEKGKDERVVDVLYKYYRCGWVHQASASRPTSGDKFIIDVEDIDRPGKSWKTVTFPWDKMVEITYKIIDDLHQEANSGELPFLEKKKK